MTKKYMKSWGIDLLNPSSIASLDKWEIPRDRVVINRKLGEGAFGFVYGGEAYFNEKGWVSLSSQHLILYMYYQVVFFILNIVYLYF